MKKTCPDIHVFEGRVCSGDQFISTKEQKEIIRACLESLHARLARFLWKPAFFPPYFAKILVNTQSIACGFGCLGEKSDCAIRTRGDSKQALTSNFGSMCCEMEGGAIAQVCYLNNTAFVVIRAISDKSYDSQSVEFETSVTSYCQIRSLDGIVFSDVIPYEKRRAMSAIIMKNLLQGIEKADAAIRLLS